MFYSKVFLARKGPLSTVWIAADLQRRLKKSHYTSTDIPMTVQHIMDLVVPIALRMSGHLLLGVVRIYSKKVYYLLQDCNVVLTGLSKAFASVQLTLSEDARQAPFQSITLPDTFDLDAVNLDDEPYHTGIEDIHRRSEEEITLTDQIPIAMDHYVAISFDEDIMIDSSLTEVLPDSGAMPMEEDVVPQSTLTNVGFQDGAGPSIRPEFPTTQLSAGEHPHNVQDPEATRDFSSGDSTPPQATQPAETLRDVNNDCNLEIPPLSPKFVDKDTMNEKDIPEEPERISMNEKDIPEETERISASPKQHFGPSTPATSQGAASESQVFRGHSPPNLGLRESPPIEQPPRRGRKRKQFFDDPIVLTNRSMRGALNNPRDILRGRRDVPTSTLDTWKLITSRRKEQIFDQPLLTGLCKDLLDVSKREHICSKPHLVISDEDHEDAGIARTPSPTNQIPEEPRPVTPVTSPAVDMEIDGGRNFVASPPPTIPAHNMDAEMNIGDDFTSPVIRDDNFTPDFGSVSVSHERTNVTIRTMQTPYSTTSLAAPGSTMETPTTYVDTTLQSHGLSDTHQLINSATTEELSFLEVDNNSPASSQCTIEGISLSERTRHVAEYLRRPITPILEDPAEDLSLNKILEGKTRRISARMFFEVLVLKSQGLIDVQQEEPCGDVSLKLNPALKRQI